MNINSQYKPQVAFQGGYIVKGSREEINLIDELLENTVQKMDLADMSQDIFDMQGRYLSTYEGHDCKQVKYLVTTNVDAILMRSYCAKVADQNLKKNKNHPNLYKKISESQNRDLYLRKIERNLKQEDFSEYLTFMLDENRKMKKTLNQITKSAKLFTTDFKTIDASKVLNAMQKNCFEAVSGLIKSI